MRKSTQQKTLSKILPLLPVLSINDLQVVMSVANFHREAKIKLREGVLNQEKAKEKRGQS